MSTVAVTCGPVSLVGSVAGILPSSSTGSAVGCSDAAGRAVECGRVVGCGSAVGCCAMDPPHADSTSVVISATVGNQGRRINNSFILQYVSSERCCTINGIRYGRNWHRLWDNTPNQTKMIGL